MKFHVKKGDTVKVLAGNSKGKTGAVLEVIPGKYKAIVEGLNMVTKHTKPSAENPEGGIKKVEAPIHMSNLMLVDPASGKATKVGRTAGDNGKLVRVAKKTGEVING